MDLKRVRAQREGQPPKRKHNWVNKETRESRQRAHLLPMGGKEANFVRYDLEDLVAQSDLPAEQRSGFVAQVLAKGQRLGIDDAKEFVKEKKAEGLIAEQLANRVLTLIDRYAIWR